MFWGECLLNWKMQRPSYQFVYNMLVAKMIFLSIEICKVLQRDINTEFATANLSHTNIGVMSTMIMNCTNQLKRLCFSNQSTILVLVIVKSW